MKYLFKLLCLMICASAFGQLPIPAYAPRADFNGDGEVNQKDKDDYYLVRSEGLPLDTFDSIDYNRNGAIFEPDDDEDFERVWSGLPVKLEMPWRPNLDSLGRSIIPAAEREVFVSSSEGFDTNDGLSSNTPVRTLARAYSLMRDGRGDHMRLKCGDSWAERLINPEPGYGGWMKGGRSSKMPMIIRSYGEGPKPKLVLPSRDSQFRLQGCDTGFIWLIGLHFAPDFSLTDEQESVAFSVYASVMQVVFENCVVNGGNAAFTLDGISGESLQDVVVRRCIVRDTRSTAGEYLGQPIGMHGGVGYIVHTAGMLFEENECYTVGFHHEGDLIVRNLFSKFSQGLYIQNGGFRSKPLLVRKNKFNRVAHCAIQGRSGRMYFTDNDISGCAIGASFGHASNGPGVTVTGVMAYNRFSNPEPCPGAAQGDYVWASKNEESAIFGNTFVNPRGGTPIIYENPRGTIYNWGNSIVSSN